MPAKGNDKAVAPLLRGRLGPSELAEAAVLGDLALVLEVIGWFAPLGAIFQGLAIVPFAALAARHRARASIVAMIAVGTVAFLVGGVGIVLQSAIAGTLGLSIGLAYRRRWRHGSAVGFATLATGLPLAVISLAVEAASPGLRHLAFAQVEIVWRDASRVLQGLGMNRQATAGTDALRWIVDYWWISVPAFELVAIVVTAAICTRYLWPLLVRLERDIPPARRELEYAQPGPAPVPGASPQSAHSDPLEPVPIAFERVSFQYPGSMAWAVAQVSLVLEPGAFLALVGPNGSGKSTLVRLMSGRLAPTLGEVVRVGEPGLGEPSGTAMVFQRPESQVLGVRARDDVIWGIPDPSQVDVAGLLASVGLAGFEERETSGLSGGELQRLAIAAALARAPRLFVSDEATAMIDEPGRAKVVELLESLSASGIAVVHVTHRSAEARRATSVVHLRDGRVVPPPPVADAAPHAPPTPVLGTRLLELNDVGYVYSAGTPWAHRALSGVTFEVRRREGLVVTGPNGSGKSTLAWLLAGLAPPTEGSLVIEGRPLLAGTGQVGIAFQHARLQLLSATVLADVALGAGRSEAEAALRSVGLDPSVMGPRRVDELSGGEQRRVALAGLLVHNPPLLVLDEPYAGLDDEARANLAALLAELRRTRDIATVVVSHDLDNAELLGDRLLVLEAGRVVSERSAWART